MRKRVKKNFRVLRELVRIRFQRMMMFRIGLLGPILVDVTLFAVQLLVFRVVYAGVDRIGTWGEGEMILFIGTFSLISALSMMIFYEGISQIPEKIRKGDLDLYLTKPVSPLFRITFEQINPSSIPLLVMSLCIIYYGACKTQILLNVKTVCAYLGWITLMTILYYDMMVLMRSVCFYFVTNARLEQLEEASLELCRKLPGIAFHGIYRIIFGYLLPYALLATLPVQSVIGEMGREEIIHGIAITIVFTGLTGCVWKKGVRYYNSATS